MTKETQPNQKKKPNEALHNINTEPCTAINTIITEAAGETRKRNK